MQERFDSLANSVKESGNVEPTVVAPATGKKVSIPDVFSSSSNSTPTSSPTHKVTPTTGNGVVGNPTQQNGNVVVGRSPVPHPRNRQRVAEGSASPSPKIRRSKLRNTSSSGEDVAPPPW